MGGHQQLQASIFELSPAIRYVALNRENELTMSQRPDLVGASESESDRYEELFINPTLLTLIRQRGNLDCGGARYLVIRYGNFYQLVVALPDGHVSVCFELAANPLDFADMIETFCG